jgi:hypothetical protein
MMRISMFAFLTEAHHEYDHRREGFAPLKRGDTVRVFHGFRSPEDAMRLAKMGLSGALRASRVYSYEANNNPKGLFVTANINVAKNFVGAYGTRTIVEFNARAEDLETPVWPGGSYTVQGQMASYFDHDHAGRRQRSEMRKNTRLNAQMAGKHISDSDDPATALTLMTDTEMQALFIGHLDPQEVTCFWVEGERGQWASYSVEEYISEFAPAMGEEKRDWHRVFTANEDFSEDKFLTAMRDMGGDGVEETLARLWRDVLKAEPTKRARSFLYTFEQFLWPKQYIPCMQWMAKKYGRRPDSDITTG